MLRAGLTLLAPLLAAITLIAVSAWQLHQPAPMTQASEWVRTLYRQGDLVLLYPENRLLDLVAFDGTDALAASSVPTELQRFDRVFLVRTESDSAPPIQRMLGARGRLVLSEGFGDVVVELFQLSPAPPVSTDLSATVADATVWIEPDDGEPVPCPWVSDRFQCGEADWTYVGRTQQGFDGQPHACIWSHPVEDATLVIAFDPLPPFDRVTGWFGLTDYAVSIPDGRRTTLLLEAGSTERRFMARRIRGRTPVDVTVSGGAEALRLEVSADGAGVRHLCWDLQTHASPALLPDAAQAP